MGRCESVERTTEADTGALPPTTSSRTLSVLLASQGFRLLLLRLEMEMGNIIISMTTGIIIIIKLLLL